MKHDTLQASPLTEYALCCCLGLIAWCGSPTHTGGGCKGEGELGGSSGGSLLFAEHWRSEYGCDVVCAEWTRIEVRGSNRGDPVTRFAKAYSDARPMRYSSWTVDL